MFVNVDNSLTTIFAIGQGRVNESQLPSQKSFGTDGSWAFHSALPDVPFDLLTSSLGPRAKVKFDLSPAIAQWQY
jgi:hypothetical protein